MMFRPFDEKFIKAASNPVDRQKAIDTYSFVRSFTFIIGLLSFGFVFFSDKFEIIECISGIVFLFISGMFDLYIKVLKLSDELFQDTEIKDLEI